MQKTSQFGQVLQAARIGPLPWRLRDFLTIQVREIAQGARIVAVRPGNLPMLRPETVGTAFASGRIRFL
ncbi:MAG: hypothetical protein GWN46_03025, partial [Gammaproteobacteria bacterium]|nr:hypothetical protein [Gammaproteobacteria bacterium]